MELNGIFKSSLIMTKVFKFWAQIENFVKENLCIPEMTGLLLVFCLFYFPTQKGDIYYFASEYFK